MGNIKERIADVVLKSHTRPYSTSELVALLIEANEEIDNLQKTLKYEVDLASQALTTIKVVADTSCSNRLRLEGKTYPRTCKVCGIGKCKFE